MSPRLFLRRRRHPAPATESGPTAAPVPTPRTSPPEADLDPTASAEQAPGWTEQRIRALGTVTTVPITAEIFGVAPSTAFAKIAADLADEGTRFPVRALRIGNRYRVPVPAILAALGWSPHDPAIGQPPPTGEPPDLDEPPGTGQYPANQYRAGQHRDIE